MHAYAKFFSQTNTNMFTHINMNDLQGLAKNGKSELLWLFYIFVFASCADTVRFQGVASSLCMCLQLSG